MTPQGIRDWNKKVPPHGTVWHLGDMLVGHGGGESQVDYLKTILAQLNGHIFLLWGNHTAGVKQLYQEAWEDAHPGETYKPGKNFGQPLCWKNKLTFAGHLQLVRIGRNKIVFSHHPQDDWSEKRKGVWNICGHSHGNNPESQPDYPSMKLDVGVDNYPCPLDIPQLQKIMGKKKKLCDQLKKEEADTQKKALEINE